MTGLRNLFIVGGFALVASLGMPGMASAQDAAFGKGVWLTGAKCADCHGWMGDGVQEDPRAPKGDNLRETTLTAEQLSEVILCGRPGTGMPYFDPRAYTDARCYGMTRAQIGNQAPEAGAAQLTKRHADGLAAFILSEFAGKGAPTKALCASLLGPTVARCAQLP
ncbi:MAG: hypothetical protein FJX64_05640 [Alphaproteobacteria bacterium]|nr:hypothetical protein [Alphaproteobacteria bacterium]